MECKGSSSLAYKPCLRIGIYPEWNVKYHSCYTLLLPARIGIYPEWNVKIKRSHDNKIESYIGIYPEWNVKVLQGSTHSVYYLLEYIQNGM